MLVAIGCLLLSLAFGIPFEAPSTERCPVYTYFIELHDDGAYAYTQYQLGRSWLRNWYKFGYNPIFLSMNDTLKYSNFTARTEVFYSYPTGNGKAYEMACFQRWMAFEAAGGGTFMDYDVMTFQHLPFNIKNCGITDEIHTYQNSGPMITHGNPAAIERMITYMATVTIPPDAHHIDDMDLIRNEMYAKEWHRKNRTLTNLVIEPDHPTVIHFMTGDWSRYLQGVYNVSSGTPPIVKWIWVETFSLMNFLNTNSVLLVIPAGLSQKPQIKTSWYPNHPSILECPKQFEDVVKYIPDGFFGRAKLDERRRAILPNYPNVTCQLFKSTSWPSNLRDSFDYVFIILDTRCLNRLDIQTKQNLAATLSNPHVVPLPIQFPVDSQLLLDYTVGTSLYLPEYNSTACNNTNTDNALATNIMTKFENMLLPIREVERQHKRFKVPK